MYLVIRIPNFALIKGGGVLFRMGAFCRIQTLIKDIKKGKKLSYINSQEKRYLARCNSNSRNFGLNEGGVI